jgi:adenylyltransferase and sulfurtransferase
MEELNLNEVERYHRQILLSEMGPKGQEKLKKAKVLVIGAGGLGSPILSYLSGAGIGTIGVVDGDTVEIINLHRQVLHATSNTKLNKAESARQAILSLNPLINVEVYPHWLTPVTSREIVPKYDILVIATDNVESRYLISDLGVFYGIPVVSGSCVRWDGQLTVFFHSPCLRCLFPVPTPRHAWTKASDVGVLGPVPGVIGTLQAVEVIKLIIGVPALIGKMLLYDGLSCRFRIFKTKDSDPACPACTGKINPHEFSYSEFIGKPETQLESKREISSKDLEDLMQTDIQIIDLRSKNHFIISHIEKSINVPAYEINKFDVFSNNKPLVFVDRNGIEAAKIVESFLLKGIESSFLSGGLESWKEAHPEFILF